MIRFLDNVNHICEMLTTGKIMLCPTDTIWGLSCNALDAQAVDRIFSLKKRDTNKSCILLVNDISLLKKCIVDLHPRVETLLGFYTQPLTIIHKAAPTLPQHLLHPDGTIAIRIVRDTLLQEIITEIGKPLISTSANVQGSPSPQVFSEIESEITEGVDYIFQSGRDKPPTANPSRIVKYSSEGELFFLR